MSAGRCDCRDCPADRRDLGDVIEAHALPAIAGAILGLLLGLAIETPARQARAEQLAECQRVSAAQDRVILAASAQLDDALPLCSALADLQPVARRGRGLR
jgi:hypothetical protein